MTDTGKRRGRAAALPILKQRFGDRLQTGQSFREQHSHTTTYLPSQLPDGVVFVETSVDVQEVVRICAAHASDRRLWNGVFTGGAGQRTFGRYFGRFQRMNRILK